MGTHRPVELGEPLPVIALSTCVEFVGGPRDGDSQDRADLPEVLVTAQGRYRRSVRCAEDGAMRYVWIDAPASEGSGRDG